MKKKIFIAVFSILLVGLGVGIYFLNVRKRLDAGNELLDQSTELREQAAKCLEQGDTLNALVYLDSAEVLIRKVKAL